MSLIDNLRGDDGGELAAELLPDLIDGVEAPEEGRETLPKVYNDKSPDEAGSSRMDEIRMGDD